MSSIYFASFEYKSLKRIFSSEMGMIKYEVGINFQELKKFYESNLSEAQ